MQDRLEDLSHAFERFPGIGPRQAKRFVYHLLSASAFDRAKLARLIDHLADDIDQCRMCMRFAQTRGEEKICAHCNDRGRDRSTLMILEKDQDLLAVERANAYIGHYFVLGGVLSLTGKGSIRESDLIRVVETRAKDGLQEIVLALSATSEGEHTTDRVRDILAPLRTALKITILGRGLATGSELEYADGITLTSALHNRKET